MHNRVLALERIARWIMGLNRDLADWAVDQTVGVFRDFFDNVNSGNPSYIRDGQPESIVGILNQATARQMCRRWARETTNLAARENAGFAQMCRPYLEDIGEWPGEGTVKAPFQGGQCSGVEYAVTITGQFFSCAQNEKVVVVTGPVQGLCFEPAVGGRSRPGIVGGDGVCVTSGQGCTTADNGAEDTMQIASISRIDALPDDCGNPNSDYQPPQPIDSPLAPQPVDPTNPDLDVDVDVRFNPDGTITVTFDTGDGDDTEITFGSPFDPANDPLAPPYAPKSPGDIGQPGEEIDTGAGGEAGEGDEDRYLIGIQVGIVDFPPKANTRYTASDPIFIGAGFVYLGAIGALDQQYEAINMVDGQFFYAPEGSNAWSVSARPGYNLRITPYWKDK